MNASQVLTKRNPPKLEIAILKKSWFQTKLNRTGGKMIFFLGGGGGGLEGK